ncbi:MmgE/PrpD family protein [Cupriavidus basilensis]|uniref:MmgE/PrpD family protein n=1 Tax=Cupriavidus basilensis TaxID=68895 RepID=UPI00192C6951|nr:MmgE/PrpD family protein [Cupriavidus basilensis]
MRRCANYHHGWWVPERPLTPIGAQMNIGYALAVAVLDGAALVPQFAPSRIDADDVWALLPRIAVRHDPEFDAGGQRGRGRVRLAVTFTDGQRIEVNRQMSRAIESPQSNAQVSAKYRALTDGLIDTQRQAAIQAMVTNLEQVDDVRELLALLAPPVKSPFE